MKIQFIKNKKGDLTTKQLVIIIILIVSFIIILFLIFKLNLGGTSDKEICHNSVVLKGKAGGFVGTLDCRTNYLCISGGGKCKGISATSTVKVDPDNKKDIMKALADEMSDCWWMFGEGKIDYATPRVKGEIVCSLCSIVEFEGISVSSISYQEFYDYLRTTPKTKTQTYLQYLYPTNTLDDFNKDFIVDDYLFNKIEPTKTYFILTGIIEQGYFISIPWWKIWAIKDVPYPIVILEKTQENYDKIKCAEFVTKA